MSNNSKICIKKHDVEHIILDSLFIRKPIKKTKTSIYFHFLTSLNNIPTKANLSKDRDAKLWV
jgi:hypothetical protein